MSYINRVRKIKDGVVQGEINIQDSRIDEFVSEDKDKVLQIDDNLNLIPTDPSDLGVVTIVGGAGVTVDNNKKGVAKINHRVTTDETSKGVLPHYAIRGLSLDDFGHVQGISRELESVYSINGKEGAVELEPKDLGLDNSYTNYSPKTLPVSDNTKIELDKKASADIVKTHIDSQNNPHGVTAAQLGLGEFVGLTPGTMPLSIAGKNAYDSLSKNISSHIGNKNNPHETTANQIYAVSFAEEQPLTEHQKELARSNIGAGTVTEDEMVQYAKLSGATFTGEINVPAPTQSTGAANKAFVESYISAHTGINFDTTFSSYESLVQNIPGSENVIYLIPAKLDNLINPYSFDTYEMYVWDTAKKEYHLIGLNKIDLSAYLTKQQIVDNYIKYTEYETGKSLTKSQQAQARVNINSAVMNIFSEELPTTDTVGLPGQMYNLRVAPYSEYQFMGQYIAKVVNSYDKLPVTGSIDTLYFVKDESAENYYELFTWFEEIILTYVKTGEMLRISRADLINIPEWQIMTNALVASGELDVSSVTDSGKYIDHYMTEDVTVKDGDVKYLWETNTPRPQVINHVIASANFSVDTVSKSLYIIG